MRSPWRALCLSLLVLLSVFSLAQAKPEADSAVLFIGDGMGPNQVAMTAGAVGHPLAFQRFPYGATATTFSADEKVTDSAGAGTALATGTKTNNGMIAVSPGGQRLETILERCRAQGKSVGVISNDSIWGATPASFVAHAPSRGQYAEIARQVAESRLQVMMGWWDSQFLPTAAGGKREDGRDLIAMLQKEGYEVVRTREQLLAAKQPRLLGLFDDGPTAPRLADTVRAALSRLSTNRRGFFLIVEQSRVDWEPGDPSAIVGHVRELDEAAAAAQQFARQRGRMLVVVTSDHETGGLVIDTPSRLPLLLEAKGAAGEIAGKLNADRSNAAGVLKQWGGVPDPTPEEVTQLKEAKDAGEAVGAILSRRAGVRWTSDGDHTATPVRVFAFGPGAERFTGELDNTQISPRIAEALGLGPFPKR